MYIKLNNGEIEKYPYSINELLKDNPQVSFPKNINADILAQFNVFEVLPVQSPSDYTKNIKEDLPNLINGEWHQNWSITDKSKDEINSINEGLRTEAYRDESDPLFFKAQRGEIEMQVWIDKVAEIKTRYPKV